jgi:hypothetical protein
MEADAGGTSFFILYLFSGVGNCVIFLLGLYNLIALIGVMRSEDEVGASGLAKGAWGVGCLAAVLFPCAPLLSLIAIVLSRVEISRVYRDESPLASATPARMGSVNGGVALVVWLLVTVGAILNLAI